VQTPFEPFFRVESLATAGVAVAAAFSPKTFASCRRVIRCVTLAVMIYRDTARPSLIALIALKYRSRAAFLM